MLKLQTLSDLHLEVGQQYSGFHIPVCAPYLVLAGDTGRLDDYDRLLGFLEIQCKNFLRVFLVLGNHEFYGLSWDQAHERALQLAKEPRLLGRLILLDRRRVELSDRVVLLGCTLWSHIRPESELIVKSRVKDFTRIKGWSIEKHNEEHRKDLQWLKDEVQNIRAAPTLSDQQLQPKKIVVVTHHAPIREGSSRPEHLQNPWIDAFATELLQQDSTHTPDIASTNDPLITIDLWLFGHTHFTTECKRGHVKLVSNQRGYVLPGQAENMTRSGTKQPETVQATEPKQQRKPSMFGSLSKGFRSSRGNSAQVAPPQVDAPVEDARDNQSHSFDVRKVVDV